MLFVLKNAVLNSKISSADVFLLAARVRKISLRSLQNCYIRLLFFASGFEIGL
jgi:hypothetical protein